MPTKKKSTRKVVRKTSARRVSPTKKRVTVRRRKSIFGRLLRDNKGSINSAKIKKSKFSKNRLTPISVIAVVVVAGLSIFAFSLASTAISLTITGVTSGASLTSPVSIGAVPNNATPVRVVFYLDGKLILTDTTSPYCLNGNTGKTCNNEILSDGSHTVEAVMTSKITTGSKRHQKTTVVTTTKTVTFKIVSPQTTTSGSGSSGSGSSGSGSSSTGSGSTGSGSTSSGSTGSGSTSSGSGSTSSGSGSSSGSSSSGSSTTAVSPTGVSGNWTLKFDDEFSSDSSLNTTTWSPDWFGNNNTQNSTVMESSNVTISGGYLNLEATSNSGAIISTNPDDGQTGHTGYQFSYGFAEARIYLPASGTEIANWPAWWTDGQNWPTDGEMDIMEGLGGSACYHFHDPAGGPGDCASGNYTGWHTYGADWQPGSVTYYYDGKDVGSIASGITSAPMYLILENSTGSYGGPVVTPSDMQVQYVRVWQ